MAEIVFSCSCGMILKVYGDDQPGSRIECPACKASVVVPGGRSVSAPQSAVGADRAVEAASEPESGMGYGFVAVYLAITALVTVGLVKYLLMPMLAAPTKPVETVAAARTDLIAPEVTKAARKSSDPEVPSVPKRPRKSAPRVIRGEDTALPVYPADASDSDRAPAKARTVPVSPPVMKRADPAPPPVSPPVAKRADPASDSDKPSPKPAVAKANEVPKSNPDALPDPDSADPFPNISNKAARQALTFALKNTRHVKATLTAEGFLKQAEAAGNGDAEVLAEVKKIRQKIKIMRDR
jgi:hypothetical protein